MQIVRLNLSLKLTNEFLLSKNPKDTSKRGILTRKCMEIEANNKISIKKCNNLK